MNSIAITMDDAVEGLSCQGELKWLQLGFIWSFKRRWIRKGKLSQEFGFEETRIQTHV